LTDVLLRAELYILIVSSSEELFKDLEAEVYRKWQNSDCRTDAIPSSDPVPESEDLIVLDPKLPAQLEVGAAGAKMLANDGVLLLLGLHGNSLGTILLE